MGDLTNLFDGKPFVPGADLDVDPPEVQLADEMRRSGIEPPADIQIDGQMHRFSTKGRARDDSGWYIIFPDEPIAGRFGCWRDQIDAVFRADIGRELSTAENMAVVRRQSEARAERDRDRQRKATAAAETIAKIWRDCMGADPDHPYLRAKGIEPHGARATGDGRLIVPLYTEDGDLSSLQYIGDEKRYHPGGITKGCSWTLGEVTPGPIFVAEGYATAATVHEVSGRPVTIAYSANNLPEIVRQLRSRHGATQEIVIVADNDASGVGRNKADEASARYGGRIVMPPTEGDANDYRQSGGDLATLLFPPSDDWITPFEQFKAQPAPIRWQIKHWLQSNALIMVHGPSGGGKTFVVLDMVLSVASKGEIPDWFGHKVRHGSVVYLAGEGHHGLRGRVAAWCQEKGVKSPDGGISRHGVDLNTPQGYQKTVDAIRSLPSSPEIIVVDTLHRFLNGDENSAQDAKTMLDACGGLMQEFDCSVILVHHTGVNAEAQHRARGSSAWRGALDIEISVVPGETIELIQRKSKDAEEAAPLYVELKSVPIKGWMDEDGEQVTSAVLVEGMQPVKAQKDTKLERFRKELENGWFSTGQQVRLDRPYIPRKEFKKIAIEQFSASENPERMVANYLGKTYKTKLIGYLTLSGCIEEYKDPGVNDLGWVILDDVWSSALMMTRDTK